MVKTDARHLRRKNAKALRLAIENSERNAKEAAMEASRIANLKLERDRVVNRIEGLIVLFDSDDEDRGSCTSSDNEQDPPPTINGYSCADD
ncbi:Bifunctional dihydroflavonol 4-reductase/flavanone 4-reductase [Hordeum vulgare]|nr:Bifunctional dihydroflavonol 4-reductase/flavanone 4-reductase [Hordeum vulgare]